MDVDVCQDADELAQRLSSEQFDAIYSSDLMRAQRVAGASSDPTGVVFALIAELVEIDGARIVYEDLLAMDLNDVLALQAEVVGANFQDPPPAPSLPFEVWKPATVPLAFE